LEKAAIQFLKQLQSCRMQVLRIPPEMCLIVMSGLQFGGCCACGKTSKLSKTSQHCFI
jgi:hypothetical protein